MRHSTLSLSIHVLLMRCSMVYFCYSSSIHVTFYVFLLCSFCVLFHILDFIFPSTYLHLIVILFFLSFFLSHYHILFPLLHNFFQCLLIFSCLFFLLSYIFFCLQYYSCEVKYFTLELNGSIGLIIKYFIVNINIYLVQW